MRRQHRTPIVSLTLALALAGAAAASAADHAVTIGNDFFSPKNLTIQVGDRVTWTNATGVAHNAVADGGSFSSGTPTGNWTFSHTFGAVGDFPYHCQIHGSAGGIGMSGTITVQGAAGVPGNLRFSSAGYGVDEGGTATITVQRVGGDDGAVSVHYATANGSAVAGSDYNARSGNLAWADNDDDPKSFTVPTIEDSAVEGNETVILTLSAPGGGAGLGSPATATLTIRNDDSPPTGSAGNLAFSTAEVSAAEGDGQAAIDVVRTGGSQGNVSVQVKSANGTALAGQDYTAIASTVSFGAGDTAAKHVTVPILDDGQIEEDETFLLMLQNPTGGATLGAPGSATVSVLDDDVPPGPCVDDEHTLCLHDDRFRVQVSFRPPGGATQLATRIPFTERAGLFWFFNPANVEMLIKVQNACIDPFDRYWVFFAATTNVEFTVTVVDTQAGKVRRYNNSQGVAALPIQDTDAFATCP